MEYNGVHAGELWSTVGTAEGTELVADVLPGVIASDPTWLTWFDDRHLFSARGALWSCEPTRETTQIVRDFNASDLSLVPAWLTTYQDQIIFTADDGQHGRELWRTDPRKRGLGDS